MLCESRAARPKLAPVRLAHATAVVAAGMIISSCQPGKAAEVAMPATPSASEAVDGKCPGVSPFAEPLVVDGSPAERSNLELAMRSGLAVVSYSCKGLRVLPRCSAAGTYQYFGVTMRDQVVRLKSEDEVALNLPVLGVPLAAKLRGELARGTSLDIGMRLVGKRSAAVSEVDASSLVGECEGATHVVRGAHVGAFAMATSADASVTATAQVLTAALQARSSRQRAVATRDGDLAACAAATRDAKEAPKNCAAPIRLELLQLGREYRRESRVMNQACPVGYRDASGKCTSNQRQVHACVISDLPDCANQCSAGNADSCVTLGYAYDHARGVVRNPSEAFRLYQKGCDAGADGGCFLLALMHYNDSTGIRQDYARAAELNELACRTLPEGCTNLAAQYERGHGVPVNEERSAALLARACRGGYGLACGNLGNKFMPGGALKSDPAFAARLYARGCEAGVASACEGLAGAYSSGVGVERDVDRARKLREYACARGDPFACALLERYNVAAPLLEAECSHRNGAACWVLAQMYRGGKLGLPDTAKAAQLSIDACAKNDHYCTDAGVAYVRGDGVPKDVPRARDLFRRACKARDGLACTHLGALYALGEGGVQKDTGAASKAFEEGCSLGDKEGCDWLKRTRSK